MIIANPIYDVVFKHLMDNIDIAKGVISTIINQKIVTLDFSTLERPLKIRDTITLLRVDFIAKIKLDDGGYKNVLIEIQKAKLPEDISRFRNYLGRQYLKKDEIINNEGVIEKASLPIITIYFLGFNLTDELPSTINVKMGYYDAFSGEKINKRNSFIESLTHDAHIIQILSLKLTNRTQLERILSVFKQEHFVGKDKHLINYDEIVDDPLVQKMLRELHRIQTEVDVQERMDTEDEVYAEIEAAIRAEKKRADEAIKQTKEAKLEVKEAKLEVKEAKMQTKEAKLETKEAKKQIETEKKRAEKAEKQLDQEKEKAEKQREEEREKAINALMSTGMSREKTRNSLGIC